MYENFAYIALGSNKGDKFNYLLQAVAGLKKNENCLVEKISSIYETLPYGNKEQGNFLNAVLKISTNYLFLELLNFLKELEKEIGRETAVKWGPREIDLDLLFYNDIIYSDTRVTIPHKEITKRDFVLIPLCEIAPELIHPVLNKKICDICIEESERNIIGKIPEKLN